jgi:hypothetical protein
LLIHKWAIEVIQAILAGGDRQNIFSIDNGTDES